ncbi:MAG: hypothetical protein EKK53_23200 [Burkholderiales bacterium]|nr:MAG: hypothetical protein EKK53_23200 [Burkholderiales bacterium]
MAAALGGHAAAEAQTQPPSRLGSLLITLPDSEFVQRLDLDQPDRLSDLPDRNAKGARFFAANRYYFKIQDSGFKQDTLTVYAADTGRAAYVASRVPRLSDVEPSPLAEGVFFLTFLGIASDTGVFAVVDLANGQRVLASYKGEVGQYLHWWMPDGSLRRLHAHTGELSAWSGRLQDAREPITWQVLGVLSPPLPGQLYATAVPSPSGQELLLSTVDPRSRHEDLWMVDMRDGTVQRVTRDGFVSFVRWSPDGRSLLLRRSNVSSINTTFRGQCSYWIVPSSGREVSGLVPGIAHALAQQVFYGNRGSPQSLPCGKVAAWMP